MKLTFNAKLVKTEKNQHGTEEMTVEVLDTVDFLTRCVMCDEAFNDFLSDAGAKKYLLHKVGIEDLKSTFTKEELQKLCEGLDLTK